MGRSSGNVNVTISAAVTMTMTMTKLANIMVTAFVPVVPINMIAQHAHNCWLSLNGNKPPP